MALPTFQSQSREFNMMQNRWASELNPLLALPTSTPAFLKGIVLTNQAPVVINHKLGRKPIGWVITDLVLGDPTEIITIYRTADLNDLTLTLKLNSTGVGTHTATVSLLVF